MDAFDKLAYPIQKWIRNQGWRELRDIQARATHAVMDGQSDLIIAASTAGGKTEAAFLPLISQAISRETESQSGFDLVYIGPLKALINDQQRRLEDICQDTGLTVFPWHGDISASVKSRARKSRGGILLITPESLEALFVQRGAEIPRLFGRCEAVVIDELHTFLDSERGVQLRSLLARVELATSRKIRRIGLSATLGDMEIAKTYLRPGDPETVDLLSAEKGDSELRIQLRGYIAGDSDPDALSADAAVAKHLFEKLRGSNNLVFAGARQRVELFADRLREMCERSNLPQEFYPHHASLSRDHRHFIEQRLKDGHPPTTAVCTSTLELGIDIGDVKCIAQVGAPFTVASLRQRLGRSGRREGQPAILRQYAIEAAVDAKSNYVDRLRLGLVRSIAMIELLLEGWCESPRPQALHLSTLVHQILSVIAERGGVNAKQLFSTLCQAGPFSAVDSGMFAEMLRALGDPDIELIEQADDGLLLLGQRGEKLVEHYSFYAVFQTPEEFRLISDGRELGTIPVTNTLAPGMTIIFSGRRWEVVEIDEVESVILVKPAGAGVPPIFGGDPGDIDDRVIQKMHEVLLSGSTPVYLDQAAVKLLAEARANFQSMGFGERRIVPLSETRDLISTWAGTVTTTTLALLLRGFGFEVEVHDGFLEVEKRKVDLSTWEVLGSIANKESIDPFEAEPVLIFEKFHTYLTRELLQRDALSSRLDVDGAAEVARRIVNDANRNFGTIR